MDLSAIIKDRIGKEGPISFHDFMEMALYYPDRGYYTSGGSKIGSDGDFYTSPCVTALFGEMLSNQLEEMWQLLRRSRFTIVEYGAGTGLLCRDILDTLKEREEFYGMLDYVIVEKSAPMREKEQQALSTAGYTGKVRWVDSITDIPPVTGCILSNELIDNFPVHRVTMEEGLKEVFVNYRDGFSEILRPAGETLKDYFHELEIELPEGFRTEVNLQAIEWMRMISKKLERGFVLTIDYGHPSSVLYSQGRSTGTLACYHRHQVGRGPYDHIGEQDITAHVNFSALQHWGRRAGLEYCGYTNQTLFLQALGLVPRLKKIEEEAQNAPQTPSSTSSSAEQEKMVLINTFLINMGTRFKVLIQQKGIRSPWLSGLRFAGRL